MALASLTATAIRTFRHDDGTVRRPARKCLRQQAVRNAKLDHYPRKVALTLDRYPRV